MNNINFETIKDQWVKRKSLKTNGDSVDRLCLTDDSVDFMIAEIDKLRVELAAAWEEISAHEYLQEQHKLELTQLRKRAAQLEDENGKLGAVVVAARLNDHFQLGYALAALDAGKGD